MPATIPTSNTGTTVAPVMQVVVVDLETGGLDATVHGVTEIAAVSCTINANYTVTENATFQRLIKPVDGLRYDPEALRIQGRTLEYLTENGVSETEAWRDFRLFFDVGKKGQVAVGKVYAHNAVFDHAFLANMQERQDRECGLFSRRCDFGCTKTLFHICQSLGIYRGDLSSSLRNLCSRFAVPLNPYAPHDALSDARATASVLARLLRNMESHFVSISRHQTKALREERVKVVTDAVSISTSVPFSVSFDTSDWK